jgi:hypothetical protein
MLGMILLGPQSPLAVVDLQEVCDKTPTPGECAYLPFDIAACGGNLVLTSLDAHGSPPPEFAPQPDLE